jgi:hypothetical protein
VPIDEMIASTGLRATLVMTNVELWDAADCAEVIEELSLTVKAASGVVALAAARLASMDSSNGPEWLARKNGITPAVARRHLDTAKKVDKCQATKAALQDGTLSLDQASEIASAEAAVPGSEPELLDLARTKGLGPLRERARDIRLGAVDPDDLRKRQRGLRSVRTWTNRDGMSCGTWQVDHVDPVAHGGATCATNLRPRCGPEHRIKTEQDRNAGLLGKREQDRDGPRTGRSARERDGPAP